VKLTDARAQQAIEPLLQQIGETTDTQALLSLAETLKALAAKLTDVQARQDIESLLQQIGKTTYGDALGALATALTALAAKLTDAQARQGLIVAISSLGWAAAEGEAAEWARALVALLPRATDQSGNRELVAAIVYPFAAGPATEVLLDALRARNSDAPAKEAGTAATLAWIAEKYPDRVHRPICPTPPQRTSVSGLRCPMSEN
jgi:hypothetical protein